MVKNNRMPSRKVGLGAVAGAVTGILVWGVDLFTGKRIDPEVAVSISVVVTFLLQYVVRDSE